MSRECKCGMLGMRFSDLLERTEYFVKQAKTGDMPKQDRSFIANMLLRDMSQVINGMDEHCEGIGLSKRTINDDIQELKGVLNKSEGKLTYPDSAKVNNLLLKLEQSVIPSMRYCATD